MLLQTTDSIPYLTASPHSKYITLPWYWGTSYDLLQSLGAQTNNILPRGLPFVSNTITLPAFLYLSPWTCVIYSFSSSLVYFPSSLIHSLSFCTNHLAKVPKLSYHTFWTSINCQSSLISSNLVSMATKKKITENLVRRFRLTGVSNMLPRLWRCSVPSNKPVGDALLTQSCVSLTWTGLRGFIFKPMCNALLFLVAVFFSRFQTNLFNCYLSLETNPLNTRC